MNLMKVHNSAYAAMYFLIKYLPTYLLGIYKEEMDEADLKLLSVATFSQITVIG